MILWPNDLPVYHYNPQPEPETLAERLGADGPGVMRGMLVLYENGELVATSQVAALVDDDGRAYFETTDGRIHIDPEPQP